MATIAKGLVLGMLIAGQQHGSRWQIEGIFVPVEDLLVSRQSLKEGIGFSGTGERDLKEANLCDGVLPNLGAQCAGQQLAAQADAQNEDILCDCLAQEGLLLLKVAILVILIDMLCAAKRDDGCIVGQIW